MTEDDVRAALTAKGYTNIHEVEMEDGVWEADATDSSGKMVKVKMVDGNAVSAADEDAAEDAAEKSDDAADDAKEKADDAAEEAKEKKDEEHH
jgi:hypothetical protein